jgi:acyl-CoA thioester hydrolase
MTDQKKQPHTWQFRVYYEDTDAGGVVYHARYLNFFERARTELLRVYGIQSETLRKEHNLIWVVLDIHVQFRQAARLDDELLVSAELTWKKGVRQGFRQQMTRKSDGMLVATAELSAVLLHADSLKPARIPAWMETEFTHVE